MSSPSDTVYSNRRKLFLFTLSVSFVALSIFTCVLLRYFFANPLFILIFLLFSASLFFCCIYFAKIAFEGVFDAHEALQRTVDETIHELSVPVATISANVAMIMGKIDAQDKKTLERLQRIDQAAKKLSGLYENVGRRLKAQFSGQKEELFWLDKVVEQSMRQFEPLFAKKELNVEIRLSPLVIKADKSACEAAVENLLSNAVKYNCIKGSLTITLLEGLLQIEDTGVGIPEDKLFRIFDSYYQIDPLCEGFGLGMAIVKRFCDENNVAISIKSEEPTGSSFCLDFRAICVA